MYEIISKLRWKSAKIKPKHKEVCGICLKKKKLTKQNKINTEAYMARHETKVN